MQFRRKDRGVYLHAGKTDPDYVLHHPLICLIHRRRGLIMERGEVEIKKCTWDQKKKANEIQGELSSARQAWNKAALVK
jgi:hypothetical protein